MLKECEEFLRDSRRLRDLAKLKATGKTKTGRINPLAATKQQLRVTKEKATSRASRRAAKNKDKNYSKTEGVDLVEINRRKLAGECLRCAWPSDRKGEHRVKDCKQPIKIDTGTAGFARAKEYQKQQLSESGSSNSDTSEETDSS